MLHVLRGKSHILSRLQDSVLVTDPNAEPARQRLIIVAGPDFKFLGQLTDTVKLAEILILPEIERAFGVINFVQRYRLPLRREGLRTFI